MPITGFLRFQILLHLPMLVIFHFVLIISFVDHLVITDFNIVPCLYFFSVYFPLYFFRKMVEEGPMGFGCNSPHPYR